LLSHSVTCRSPLSPLSARPRVGVRLGVHAGCLRPIFSESSSSDSRRFRCKLQALGCPSEDEEGLGRTWSASPAAGSSRSAPGTIGAARAPRLQLLGVRPQRRGRAGESGQGWPTATTRPNPPRHRLAVLRLHPQVPHAEELAQLDGTTPGHLHVCRDRLLFVGFGSLHKPLRLCAVRGAPSSRRRLFNFGYD